ncbi:MAG: hypothetical protein ABF792_08705 [Bifidobacterium psychraerophilum]|jgi:hypothetical protein|uniref:hypothetical protein n=1 Tax=Bifidobacterium psychraerophilum TaxID=218140 RepID=UPI0039EAEA18
MSEAASSEPGGNEGQEPEGGDGGKQFNPPASQEEMDEIIENRLARERRKYSDYDQLKATKAEMDQWKQSQLTEQEKAIEAAKTEASAATASKYEQRIAAAEIRLQAQARGFHDPADAIGAFGKDLPIKDGDIDTDAIGKKLDELATSKPYLLKAGDDGGNGKTPKGKPKLPSGKKLGDSHDGKGKAAAMLRQFGAARHPR